MTATPASSARLNAAAHPLTGAESDYDALLEYLGDAEFVLIGEASHGTHEFYRERARLTRRLIEERGFTGVAVEADWPDAYRLNRYVRGQSHDQGALDALGDFRRFPRWMWRNRDVLDFIEWLRGHNESAAVQTGFYGLDLYSFHQSMRAVIKSLDQLDPAAAARARQRYSCFEPFGYDPQRYGVAAAYGVDEPCESQVVAQLSELQAARERRPELLREDEHFYAEQNARLAVNAERYYRAMFLGRDESWNLRDTHMADTLDALAAHQRAQGLQPRLVVWAHNSHLGDARASEMHWRQGELNVGQLVRQRHGGKARLLGLTTAQGEVLAASDWDGPAERKTVRPPLPGSLEDALQRVGMPDFWLDHRALTGLGEVLQRFIGVIYRPQTERQSHYLRTRPAEQYDAVLHFGTTQALTPLDADSGGEDEDWPDTYPSGE
ncbi:erythromycin esterase [Deinococcus irradiatisoli]|uniref:Erythromycin esterase n=1 Tax=Deinococcus irradiatisoli TaxID=2202254 RepID=A0A2Z3JB04_9DEIO|nr:erythromycin esterase family protein [Deinococcus irradiatisoli]AWN22307.1 erythromycin esterase [Deinococcus irradiatisoli]